MQERDIIERIRALCQSRSWSVYRLAQASGITYSTLCTVLHKSTAPSIPTLMRICDGFGITLAQFFDTDNSTALFTAEDKAHLNCWKQLSESNRQAAEKYIRYLVNEQKKQNTLDSEDSDTFDF